jgi:hypothetical protein
LHQEYTRPRAAKQSKNKKEILQNEKAKHYQDASYEAKQEAGTKGRRRMRNHPVPACTAIRYVVQEGQNRRCSMTIAMVAPELGKIKRIGQRRLCTFIVNGEAHRYVLGLDKHGYFVARCL